MSILPFVLIPQDYQKPSEHDSTWAIKQAQKSIDLANVCPQAKTTLELVNIGGSIYSYINETSDTPPLEGSRFQQIKNDCVLTVNQRIRPNVLFRIASHTILIIEAYTGFYNLFAETPVNLTLLYQKRLIIFSKLFLSVESLFSNIDWIKIIEDTIHILIYMIQLITLFTTIEVSIGIQIVLGTILYGKKLYHTLSKECEEIISMKDAVKTSPKISMTV